uniref:Uncharacterized protein n=1 Tax=Cyprinodon variegatus TaxID=28743 RepID=A0A3Q2GI05_CYPVA
MHLQSRNLPPSPHHLGYTYKKVMFVEYTDEFFTEKKNPSESLLGPILKGKVDDKIYIIFKNLASRPFNIYPNGLTKVLPFNVNGKHKRIWGLYKEGKRFLHPVFVNSILMPAMLEQEEV